MALHFDFTKVKNNETVCLTPEGEIRIVTDALIWLTMAIDLGGITPKNVEEFIVRLRMYEMVAGPTNISAEAVRAHVGLSTNVSDTTDAQFAKKLTKLMRERAVRGIRSDDADAAGVRVHRQVELCRQGALKAAKEAALVLPEPPADSP